MSDVQSFVPSVQAYEQGKEALEQIIKASAETATKGYANLVALTKDQVATAAKAAGSAFKNYDEVSEFGKEGVDALVASSNVIAKGFESIAKSWMEYGEKSAQASVGAAKDVLAAKNLKDFVEWQTQYARLQFDALFAQTTKLSELGIKTAQDAFEPLTERFHVAVEKMLKQASA